MVCPSSSNNVGMVDTGLCKVQGRVVYVQVNVRVLIGQTDSVYQQVMVKISR
jgi:hypothetical protein